MNENNGKEWYRQGDVGIICSKIPEDVEEGVNHLILAEGEVTGHKHEVIGDAILYEHQGTLYLKVNDVSVLTHPDHNKIELRPGEYKVFRQREYSPDGWRLVSD